MRLDELPPVPGVEHRDVDVGGVRLHVAQAGDGPPVVLLHGWPQHWWCWRKMIPRLAEQHRVIAPDLRGWGWSDAPPGDYAKATFAADLLALIDALGLDRVRVIGHDWGGYAAFLLALEHPDRVERLVALDVPPPWRGRPRPRQLAAPLFLSYQALLASPVIGTRTMTASTRFVRTIIRAGSGRRMKWSDAELDAYAEVLREPPRAAASSACYRTFLTRELPANLRGSRGARDFTVPALVLMGGESFLRRVVEPEPAPFLEVGRVDGAGHFLPEEAPSEVLERALRFLEG